MAAKFVENPPTGRYYDALTKFALWLKESLQIQLDNLLVSFTTDCARLLCLTFISEDAIV
jgi:hypothetical protein